jgi:hypothetical protein
MKWPAGVAITRDSSGQPIRLKEGPDRLIAA